eukprot:gene12409-13693_t
MLWTSENDQLLLREVIAIEPYLMKPYTRERGQAWTEIAQNLNKISKPMFRVSQRSVHEHYTLLGKQYIAKTANESRTSGIEVEVTPSDQLLEDIIEKTREAAKEFAGLEEAENAKAKKEQAAVNDVKNKALESLSETMKRKSADCRR